MKKLIEIEFAIDYLRGHTDEEIPKGFPNTFSSDILNSYEKDLIARTLEWVLKD